MIRYDQTYWEDVNRVIDAIPNAETLYNTTICLTGATGLICSGVAELLLYLNRQRNANIRIVLAGRSRERTQKRFYLFEEGVEYEFVYYDATTSLPVSISADYIIHGASNANPAIYVKQPVETLLANIVGLNQMLQMAVKENSKRLLFISSSEVYGKKLTDQPYKENDYGYVDILNPRGAYPNGKRGAETLCASYGQQYGLDTVIVRPGHIYGPGITDSDSRASAQFTRNAANGEDIVMKSEGKQLRSYCYALDCASAILAVLINGENGQAYNISNKDSVCTISEMARALAEAVGKNVVYEMPTDTEKMGYNLMDNSSLDANRLEALGWHGVFCLSEGARRTVDYFEVTE